VTTILKVPVKNNVSHGCGCLYSLTFIQYLVLVRLRASEQKFLLQIQGGEVKPQYCKVYSLQQSFFTVKTLSVYSNFGRNNSILIHYAGWDVRSQTCTEHLTPAMSTLFRDIIDILVSKPPSKTQCCLFVVRAAIPILIAYRMACRERSR
jgi:hypothetical protein